MEVPPTDTPMLRHIADARWLRTPIAPAVNVHPESGVSESGHGSGSYRLSGDRKSAAHGLRSEVIPHIGRYAAGHCRCL